MKKWALDYIKNNILILFMQDNLYGKYEFSEKIYKKISSVDDNWTFDEIIVLLNNVQKKLSINDNNISYLVSVLNSEIELQRLIDSKKTKGFYDENDLVLVRSTDFLPENGEIISISNVPFVTKMQSAIGFALNDYLTSKNERIKEINKELSDMDERDFDNIEVLAKEREKILSEISEKADELSPFFTYYRSTIHFCLNGLVTDHSLGSFERKFIIIEPFKHHVADETLLSLRPEDTYFKENFTLSKEAVILVDEKYKKDIESWGEKDKYNIVFYKGDRFIAVRMQLIKMGIVPEEVKEHNIEDTKTSSMVIDYIVRNNYDTVSHFNSEVKKEDELKTVRLNEMYEIQFYNYLSEFIVDERIKEKLLFEVNSGNMDLFTLIPICAEIIESLGIEKYTEIVNRYNEKILQEIKQGLYPNNNELLSGEKTKR